MPQQPLFRINDFRGGLNTVAGGVIGSKDNPTGFNMNQASYCNNFVLSKADTAGALSKVQGNSTLLTLDEPCTGLYKTTFKSGTEALIATGLTQIYLIDTAAWTATTIYSGLVNSSSLSDFEFMVDSIIVTKEDNVPLVIDNTYAVTQLSGWPPTGVTGNPIQSEQHVGRLWLTRNTTHPDESYYSDFGVINSWNAILPGGAGWFGIPNGSRVKAFKSYRNNELVIYTAREIYRLGGNEPPPGTGLQPFYLDMVYDNIDFESPFGIVNIDAGQIFMNRTDLVMLKPTDAYGDIENDIISRNIAPTLNTINKSARDKIIGMYMGDELRQVWYYIPTGTNTENNQLLIFDLDSGGFFPCDNRGARCITKLDNGTILTGHSDGTIKQELTGYTANGTNITSTWRTGWIQLDDYININSLVIAHWQGGNYVSTMRIYKDDDDNNYIERDIRPHRRISTWDDMLWDDGEWDTPYIARSNVSNIGLCKAIKIEIINSEADSAFRLISIDAYKGA